MKMSGYFRRPKAQQLERRYTGTAQALADYSYMNSDLEDLSKPMVKLRLQKKEINSVSKSKSQSAPNKNRKESKKSQKQNTNQQNTTKRSNAEKLDFQASLQEVELVEGTGIFHVQDSDLKHELIDADKASKMVDALKHLKDQFSNELNQADKPGLKSDMALLDAVQFMDGGRLSVNLASY